MFLFHNIKKDFGTILYFSYDLSWKTSRIARVSFNKKKVSIKMPLMTQRTLCPFNYILKSVKLKNIKTEMSVQLFTHRGIYEMVKGRIVVSNPS